MFKRTIAWLLMLVLLTGMLPATVFAQENEVCQACRTHKTVQRVNMGGSVQIGQQLLNGGVNVALEYPNNAPAHVDTAAEKAAWIADQCRAKGITDPWQIALWLHDWLIYNANYDYTYSRYTAEGVLLEGTGVCESYTRAYRLLLQQFGIENKQLSAPVMDHTWNLVKIDGQWCHIDATWDDPNEGGYENHFYFGLTDDMMARDHNWNRSSSAYPACTSNINYYPVRMGFGFYNAEQMHALLDGYAQQHMESMEVYYLGDDPDFDSYACFNEWYQKNYFEYDFTNCWVIMNGQSLVATVMYPDSSLDDHIHNFTPVVTQPPTCTEEGYTISICHKCGENLQDDYVAALGHTGGVATCTDKAVCTRCEKAYGEVDDDNHIGGIVTKNAKKLTCTEDGYTGDACCAGCGAKMSYGEVLPASGHLDNNKDDICELCNQVICKVHTYSHKYDYKCDVCGTERTVDMTRPMVDMYRMYNPNTGEHFYTGSTVERDNLIGHGWKYEGIGFTFPLTTGLPVHRLFQPSTGEHLYTMDEEEKAMLMAKGWNYEGIAFNSGFENEVPQFRLHNPNATVGAYHFTASTVERDSLIAAGWIYQGIGWYSLGA